MWLWWSFVSAGLAVPVPDLTLKLPPIRLEAGELCYPSGLQVQAVRRPNTGLVAVSMVVSGGWSAEQPDERGAAHLVEHLWFRSRPQGTHRVDDVLAGLTNEGYTTADDTVFVTIAAPQDLPTLLDIEALRLLDPLAGLTDDDVAHERRVVHNEHLYRGEHVGRAVTQELYHALFPEGTPYAAFPTIADNDALTPETLRRYAARQYTAANVTVRVEGEVDPKTLEQLIPQAFPPALLGGTGTACLHPRADADPPAPTSTTLVRRTAPTRPTLTFGWTVPAGYTEDGDIVGRMAAAWLTRRAAGAIGTARRVDDDDVGLYCRYSPMVHASMVTCTTELPADVDPEQVLRRVRSTMGDRHVEIPNDLTWLTRTVWAFDDALARSDAFDADALGDRAEFAHHVDGEIDPLPRISRALHHGDPELVERYVERWLTPERMAAVWLTYGAADTEDSTTLDGTAVLEATRRGPWQAPSVALDGWSVAVGPGPDVWVISRPAGPPLSRATAVFRSDGPVGEPGAWWADNVLAQHDMPRVLELLNGTATRYGSYNAPDGHQAGAMGPAGNLEAQLYAVRNLLGPITYFGRGSSIREWRGDDAREDLREFPEPFAAAVVDDHLFPGHPYADSWWELDERAARVTRGDLRAWRTTVVRPSRGAVVVSGRVDAAPAAAVVQAWLGDWRVKPAPELAPAPALPDALPRAIHGLAWDYPAVWTRVACRIAPRTADNGAAIDVLEVLLQRGMQQTLRDRGGAYGLSAWVGSDSTVSLVAEVGARSGRPAVDAMFDLLARVGAGVSPGLIEWGQRAALNQRAERLASASGAHDVAVDAIEAGLTFDELARWSERLAAVDAASLQALLAPCLGREVAVIVAPGSTDLGPDAAWWPWEAEAAAVAR